MTASRSQSGTASSSTWTPNVAPRAVSPGPARSRPGVVGRIERPAADASVVGPGLERGSGSSSRRAGPGSCRSRTRRTTRPACPSATSARASSMAMPVVARPRSPVRLGAVERRVAGHVVGVDVGPERHADDDRLARARIRRLEVVRVPRRPTRGHGAARRGGRSSRASRTRSPATTLMRSSRSPRPRPSPGAAGTRRSRSPAPR